MRLILPILLVLGLAACERQHMPGWLPEAIGGPIRHDKLFDGPLRLPVIENGARRGMPPLESLRPNGIRVSIAPTFGDQAFIVDFVPQPLNCYLPDDGNFVETRWPHEGCAYIRVDYSIIDQRDDRAPAQRHRFIIPEEAFRVAVIEFNGLAEQWRGSHQGWTDGTMVGIEQYRGGRLRSIESNAPYSHPVAAFTHQVHRLLLAFAPTGTVPRSYDFTIETLAEYPCQGTSFNVADADGFGVGDDPCARFLAERSRGSDGVDRAGRDTEPAGIVNSSE